MCRAISLVLLLTALAGCRILYAGEVSLPTDGRAFRVICSYELANCLRYAREHCGEGFEQITRKSCPRCGRRVPLYPLTEPPIQMPSYRGDLYYQCIGKLSTSRPSRAGGDNDS